MPFEDLATELLLQILFCCNSVQDVFALALTCRRLFLVLSSDPLPILYRAAEAQLGPLTDAIRVATFTASRPVHLRSPSPPQSIALLARLLPIGRFANRLVDIYPSQKWRGSASDDRRLLTSVEAQRLRRALYRLWLYSLAFHNSPHERETRQRRRIVKSRAALLRAWNNGELAEMLDVHEILRSLVAFYICPSNGTVLRRFHERYPNDPKPDLITMRLKDGTLIRRSEGCYFGYQEGGVWGTRRFCVNRDSLQGWGTADQHYYIVEDMLKLEPGDIVWLYDYITLPTPRPITGTSPRAIDDNFHVCENTHPEPEDEATKCQIDATVTREWFQNNGQTFVETMELVVGERGERGDMAWLKHAVAEGEEGIVRGSFE